MMKKGLTDSEIEDMLWVPDNGRTFEVTKTLFGWNVYLTGAVFGLEQPYSFHLTEKKAIYVGEAWVEEGNVEYRESLAKAQKRVAAALAKI